MISHLDFQTATGATSVEPFEVDALDLTHGATARRLLTFLDDELYLESASQNPRLRVILTTARLAKLFPMSTAQLVVVDDPRWHYYTLHNYLVSQRRRLSASNISGTAQIHASAHVAAEGVIIEGGVVVEANATILPSSTILRDAIIRAGAIIGTIGFEQKRTTRGIVSVLHDGGVIIGPRSEIGSSSVVAQGFARRDTILGEDVKVDCNVMIAHGNQIGDRVFIAAGAVLSGSISIGNDVWIGPGAVIRDQLTISEGARVGIGSVVLRDVGANQKVLGNPARTHA